MAGHPLDSEMGHVVLLLQVMACPHLCCVWVADPGCRHLGLLVEMRGN